MSRGLGKIILYLMRSKSVMLVLTIYVKYTKESYSKQASKKVPESFSTDTFHSISRHFDARNEPTKIYTQLLFVAQITQ